MTEDAATKLLDFWQCVRAGGHDFADTGICRRCGAEKGGKSLAEILAESLKETKT